MIFKQLVAKKIFKNDRKQRLTLNLNQKNVHHHIPRTLLKFNPVIKQIKSCVTIDINNTFKLENNNN